MTSQQNPPNLYLSRYATTEQLIDRLPDRNLGIVITIPCYNESDLISSLESLRACQLPQCSVEVIIIINHSIDSSEKIKSQNQATYRKASQWIAQHTTEELSFYVFLEELPHKQAGVGLARQIAMDEAVRRFDYLNNHRGIITCYDADCLCKQNYLVAIEKHFSLYPKTDGCSIHFEHPIQGHFDSPIYQAIVEYELFLRYYIHAQKYAKLPYAFHTIGSSMAVRSSAYQQQSGMNRRKAGEDFYFLHKIIALGNFTELTTTQVIPSPRPSDRVPFGTGKAVGEWLENKSLLTYAPQTFIDLKSFVDCIPTLYQQEKTIDSLDLPQSIYSFLLKNNIDNILNTIRENTNSLSTFTKRFYHWFDAFRLLKYVHYARDHHYPNVPILEASKWLLYKQYNKNNSTAIENLLFLRQMAVGKGTSSIDCLNLKSKIVN